MANYGPRTEWLATWDLDEYLNFNGNPELSTLPERTDSGDWTYVAHRFLRQPRVSAAAAVMVTQARRVLHFADPDRATSATGRQTTSFRSSLGSRRSASPTIRPGTSRAS